MMVGLYAVVAGIFGAMTPVFKKGDNTKHEIYVVWYIVMMVESVAVIFISSFWRMLSFKKTHLMERMSLLTLIVIGEGAIGVTKTVSRIMGKYGLEVEGCFLIMCIIGVLVSSRNYDAFRAPHWGNCYKNMVERVYAN
jgi:low temperature requirement protein LtrA